MSLSQRGPSRELQDPGMLTRRSLLAVGAAGALTILVGPLGTVRGAPVAVSAQPVRFQTLDGVAGSALGGVVITPSDGQPRILEEPELPADFRPGGRLPGPVVRVSVPAGAVRAGGSDRNAGSLGVGEFVVVFQREDALSTAFALKVFPNPWFLEGTITSLGTDSFDFELASPGDQDPPRLVGSLRPYTAVSDNLRGGASARAALPALIGRPVRVTFDWSSGPLPALEGLLLQPRLS